MNALNVYPVPDGDTGTNMLHTMRTALADAREAEPTCAGVLAGATHGALMGARGNSGVLLSQIIRGVKDATTDEAGVDLRRAFKLAREYAYASVTKPAPGTMLSALKEIETAVARAKGDDERLLAEAVDLGRAAVDRTMSENPINKAAGVVDAGAKGLWYLLDGALASLDGRAVGSGAALALAGGQVAARPARPVAAIGAAPRREPTGEGIPPDWRGAYDVQFLIRSPSRPVDAIRAEMLGFGADCVLVVGDETLCKVHVHTTAPHEIIRIGLSAGHIGDVVVEDLEAMTAAHEVATGIVVPPQPAAAAPAAVGVVAVVPGEGLARIAASLGAQVVRGGPTMNPSTAELLEGIRQANAARVIVLPNDKNVVLAAEQAATLTPGRVTVVPTRNIAQGMAALAAFDPAQADVAAAMREAADRARGIEVTRAVRDATVDGEQVRKGEHIALLDGRLGAHGADEGAVVAAAAGALAAGGLLTVYVGAGVDDARRDAVVERLRAACPAAEVEVVDGGQPHYPFVIAAE